jgi:hypothetical protein
MLLKNPSSASVRAELSPDREWALEQELALLQFVLLFKGHPIIPTLEGFFVYMK